MKCPACAKSITSPKACPFCGYIFTEGEAGKLDFYFDIKGNFKNLLDANNYIGESIERLDKKLNKFGEAIALELERGYRPQKEKPAATAEPPTVPHAVKQEPKPQRQPSRQDMEIRLGQKWLLIVGIMAIVFGVAYFLKYSFERGWVGPEGRVAASYAAGIAMMAFGDIFRKKGYKVYGLYLFGGGIAVSYFAAFAAFQLYHLFGAPASFAIMVMITILASTMSIVYDTKWLAVLAMVGGFLTPFLLYEGKGNHVALFSYITLLNLGLLWVAFYKQWNLLNILGFIFTYLVFTMWFDRGYTNETFWAGIIFVNVFFLIYSVIPFVYSIFHEEKNKVKGFHLTVPNAFIAFGYSYYMIKAYGAGEWTSVITLLYSAVFLGMASYLYKRGKSGESAFVLLIAEAAFFLAVTVPILFSGHWITIFWAAQAVAYLWISVKLARKSMLYGAFIVLGLSIFKFLFNDYPHVFRVDIDRLSILHGYNNMLGERWVTSVFLLAGIYAFASMLRKNAESPPLNALPKYVLKGMYVLFGCLLFIVLNVETGAFFYTYLRAAQFAAISVLWAIFSVSLMLVGFIKSITPARNTAFVLFGITAIKVFLFDMSKFSTPYRIFSFTVFGLILVGTSFAYHKYKDRIFAAIAVKGGDTNAPGDGPPESPGSGVTP
ncbi:MAG: DUF2339 domain-containing protein [Nitrospirae bacterium]|nr:DUF2339 domain-containing protein [Nitrospirota bacterium]